MVLSPSIITLCATNLLYFQKRLFVYYMYPSLPQITRGNGHTEVVFLCKINHDHNSIKTIMTLYFLLCNHIIIIIIDKICL